MSDTRSVRVHDAIADRLSDIANDLGVSMGDVVAGLVLGLDRMIPVLTPSSVVESVLGPRTRSGGRPDRFIDRLIEAEAGL